MTTQKAKNKQKKKRAEKKKHEHQTEHMEEEAAKHKRSGREELVAIIVILVRAVPAHRDHLVARAHQHPAAF
jgi:hypothetical protein